MKLADYFGVTVDYLVSSDQPVPSSMSQNPAPASPLGTLSPDEMYLVLAWRIHPELHDAIRKLLDMPPAETKIDTTA